MNGWEITRCQMCGLLRVPNHPLGTKRRYCDFCRKVRRSHENARHRARRKTEARA